MFPTNYNLSKDIKLRINGRYCRKEDYKSELTCRFTEPTPPFDKHQKPMYITAHYNNNDSNITQSPIPAIQLMSLANNSFLGIRYDDSDKYLNINKAGELEFMKRNNDNAEEFYSRELAEFTDDKTSRRRRPYQRGNQGYNKNINTEYRYCAIDQSTKKVKCFKDMPDDIRDETFNKRYELINTIELII